MRVRHASRDKLPYVNINRDAARDDTLSLEARGLLLWLMSHAEDFEPRCNFVQKACGIGVQKRQRIYRELEEAGYMRRIKYRNRNGNWKWETIVSDRPDLLDIGDAEETASLTQQEMGSTIDGFSSDGPGETDEPSDGSTSDGSTSNGFSTDISSNNLRTKNKRTNNQKNIPDAGKTSKVESDGLWEAFCDAWDLGRDGGRYKGLCGEFQRDCRNAGATATEFRAYVRDSIRDESWGKFVQIHNCTRSFLARRKRSDESRLASEFNWDSTPEVDGTVRITADNAAEFAAKHGYDIEPTKA